MAFQILKPEIKSIPKAVWDTVKVRWQFWSLIVITSFVSIALLIFITKEITAIIPLSAVIVYIALEQRKITTLFWKQFAEVNGWHYEDYSPLEQESWVMFRQGANRETANIIKGNVNDRQFRIFSYKFSIGSGKNKKTYRYTVFAFKFNGSFPHIYLNNRHNRYSVNVGEKIPLPGEFEKKFSLSAPKEYEIEALEIFTPDVLANILDGSFTYDIELANQEMLIFTEGRIYDFEKLEKEFRRALELEDLFDEKLDKFKFQPIGDMPHSL